MNVDVTDEYLIGDSLRVNQILLNLVSNAYKFTPSGGKIEIDVKEVPQGDDIILRFSVEDTGSGMTDDMKQRLFQPFEQETAGTAKRHGGSGLGLSITKNLVELMQGSISVESTKGKGTVFFVELPFQKGNKRSIPNRQKFEPFRMKAAGENEKGQEIIVTKPSQNYDFSGHRVLLAEDQDLNAAIAKELLELVHMSVDRVSDGTEAVESFSNSIPGTYDVILMDVQMQEMDGYEATERIRALPRSDAKSIPIYAMTANAFSEDIAEALEAGMNGHIAKPIDVSALYATLQKVIG